MISNSSGGGAGRRGRDRVDRRAGGVGERVGADDRQTAVDDDLAPGLEIRAGEPHDQRHVDIQRPACLNDAFGDPIAAVDAGERR